MEAGPSLRELFAELSRGDGGDPADLLRAAGFGDVPDSLVSQAIVDYAGTAPLEVAEHLSPFAVAHGPVPVDDPTGEPATAHHGLSLLASAPVVDHGEGLVDVPAPAEHHVDVDPATLDDAHPDDLHEPVHHLDVDPADVDGLHPGSPHGGAAHHALGSFGTGHGAETGDPPDRGDAAHHGETSPAHDHVQNVDEYDHDVSHEDVHDHEPEPVHHDSTSELLDHDHLDAAHPDPAALLDGDEPHHA